MSDSIMNETNNSIGRIESLLTISKLPSITFRENEENKKNLSNHSRSYFHIEKDQYMNRISEVSNEGTPIPTGTISHKK